MSFFPPHWEPPEDPARTPCPYVTGFKVTIEAHTHPPPFGHRDYRDNNDLRPHTVPEEQRKTMTKTQLVLADPPLETAAPPQGPRETAELIITEPIATGHDRGSQVVFVLLIPADGKPPFVATAKIFDPMYYPFETFPGHPEAVSSNADREYSREASALSYATQVGLTGGFVPSYYGSWTFNLDVPGSRSQQATRPVRLVLYEQIRGTSLYSLHRRYRKDDEEYFDALHLPERYRLEVFARVLDGQVRLLHKGLAQKDLAPRNVIVSPAPAADDPEPVVERVALIDYANSIVYPLSSRKKHPHQELALPRNPMQYFRGGTRTEFDGWIPDEFPGYRKWLQETFGREDTAAKYEPVIEDPLEG